MKLSQVRTRHQRDLEGQWFWWRETIFLKVRGFSHPDYQRAARVARLAIPGPELLGEDASDAEKEKRAAAVVEREHAIGAALVPALSESILLDWWGVDMETPPIKEKDLPGSGVPTPQLVATVGKIRLETLTCPGGRIFRKDGELWQEMVPYTPEAGLAAFRDPECADLLTGVREAAADCDLRVKREDALALGKLPSTSNGTSVTVTTKKS